MSKYYWDITKIRKAVKNSINFTEVLKELNIPRQGNNIKTLKNIIIENNIDYKHFTGRARIYKKESINILEYLNNKRKIHSSKLKEKLLKENLIENKCAICNIDTWQNKPLTLQLHHIDGNNENNTLENLQLLCPNCHSQTDNYCGSANKNKIKNYCKNCGKEITKKATYCTICSFNNRRVVIRPTKEALIKDFMELKSFVGLGKKYNVTDNTIRKWFKTYGLPIISKEVKLFLSKHNNYGEDKYINYY